MSNTAYRLFELMVVDARKESNESDSIAQSLVAASDRIKELEAKLALTKGIADGFSSALMKAEAKIAQRDEALDKIGEESINMRSYGPQYTLAGDRISEKFTPDGKYIWPDSNEGKENE